MVISILHANKICPNQIFDLSFIKYSSFLLKARKRPIFVFWFQPSLMSSMEIMHERISKTVGVRGSRIGTPIPTTLPILEIMGFRLTTSTLTAVEFVMPPTYDL